MKNDKYKLTSTSIEVFGVELFQIKALKEFGSVEKGELGGYIEKEANLSHLNSAWVSGDAQVYGNARVSGGAWVYGAARVYGNARVSGDARVYCALKLKAGLFFGFKEREQLLNTVNINDDYQLVYKGDAEFGEEGSKETLKIGNNEYDKSEVEERLKGLRPIN